MTYIAILCGLVPVPVTCTVMVQYVAIEVYGSHGILSRNRQSRRRRVSGGPPRPPHRRASVVPSPAREFHRGPTLGQAIQFSYIFCIHLRLVSGVEEALKAPRLFP